MHVFQLAETKKRMCSACREVLLLSLLHIFEGQDTQAKYQTGGSMDRWTCKHAKSINTSKRADLQDILVDLADGLKHGIHFAACCHNGTLVWVHHVLHHIRALRVWGIDLGRQVQLVVPLPDVCADHLQHSALSLKQEGKIWLTVACFDDKQVLKGLQRVNIRQERASAC